MFIEPQVPTLGREPPSGSDWIHEIKHDGFRTIISIDRGRVRAFTRNGHDWTGRYAPMLKACTGIRCQSAVIDGEVVVEDENGISDFDALAWAIRHSPNRLAFFAFDLLHLDGKDGRQMPLVERRAKLAEIIAPSFALRFSEAFEGDGKAFFDVAVKHGLEGIISKHAASRYRSGPTKNWLKIKNVVESEFVLLGFERDSEGRAFAHVAREVPNGLEYAGMAFMTFSEKLYAQLSARAEQLLSGQCAVGLQRPRAAWVTPELRVRVRHLRNARGLRHASVRRLV